MKLTEAMTPTGNPQSIYPFIDELAGN